MPSLDAVADFLERLTAALADDRVGVTDDAREYAFQDFGWGIAEVMLLLYLLDEDEYSHHEPSVAPEGGMIWVFLHMTDTGRLWLRVCERDSMVVISLHRG